PRRLSIAAAALAGRAMADADREAGQRSTRAGVLTYLLCSETLQVVRPIAGGVSGFLRLPVLDHVRRHTAKRLGVVRSYPRPLNEEPQAASLVMPQEPATPGARSVCSTLFTLPTHARVTESDREQLAQWAETGRSE